MISACKTAEELSILPPLGVIDGSVLMLSAQLLVLCATLLGVEGYYDKMRDLIKK